MSKVSGVAQRVGRVCTLGAVFTLCLNSKAADRTIETSAGPVRVEVVAAGLEHPWGMDFLPDGSMLVTERPGRLRRISANGDISGPLPGVPPVAADGQGGLLDLALDPNFKRNRYVYFSYAEAGPDATAGTAVARAKLRRGALRNLRVIFRQQPKVEGPNHFGSRLAFASNRTLFVTLGERFQFSPAQQLNSHLGKIVRIRPTGSVPADNPLRQQPGVLPEIWSWGHRNIQGAAIQPGTGTLWISELGPLGGDELNVVLPGQNYGWPLVSWGKQYSGESIPQPSSRPDLRDSQYQWTPVISPSGINFYTGSLFPAWRGNLLVAALSGQALVRMELNGRQVVSEERLSLDQRVRMVRQGPDGAIYLLTDEQQGQLLRLRPAGP